MTKLNRLIRYHDDSRKERFVPFLIVLQKDRSHPRYKESLAIARYFIENAFPATQDDRLFYEVLDEALRKEAPPDYTNVVGQTPYPLPDYLKVIYDLRPSAAPVLGIKENIIEQLQVIMKQQHMTKTDLARKMNTSRASLDRLLDPSRSVTLQTLQNAADALESDLSIRIVSH